MYCDMCCEAGHVLPPQVLAPTVAGIVLPVATQDMSLSRRVQSM